MKSIIIYLSLFLCSCKQKYVRFEIERYNSCHGSTEVTIWDSMHQVGQGLYTKKLDSTLSKNMGFDSLVFKLQAQ